ncbi:MAG: hypothetical protein WAM30_10900, partial [Candidatus Dormiibacterota bacterium]
MVVLLLIGLVVAIIIIARSANSGGSCLPSGFPMYSRMTEVTTVSVGSSCTEVFRTSAGSSQVESYYST